MVDLHTHTRYSDGDSSLEELLREAEDAGVTILSITDHDTVEGYKELKEMDYSKIYSGKIVVGGEFNVVFNNAKIELLGYNFDVDKMGKWCRDVYDKNENYMDLDKEYELMIDICHKKNIRVDKIDYDKTKGWPIDFIFPSIKKYEENRELFNDKEWEDKSHFYRCCNCNMDFPLYMDFSNQLPDAREVSRAIRKFGGKVFLAHLFLYPLKDPFAYLDKLREDGIIDGIEVYHSKFTQEEMGMLEEYANRYGLYISGGTDYHGKKKKGRKIGVGYDNINVREDVVSNWINNN